MDTILIITRRFLFGMAICIFFNLNGQISTNCQPESIYGKWHCVRLSLIGYQQFSGEQAEKIKNSILLIDRNQFYYYNIDFVEKCTFSKFKKINYDTTAYYNSNLDFLYTKEELSNLYGLKAVDKDGQSCCFNSCTEFYFKQDTLIHICGGCIFFLLKIKK